MAVEKGYTEDLKGLSNWLDNLVIVAERKHEQFRESMVNSNISIGAFHNSEKYLTRHREWARLIREHCAVVEIPINHDTEMLDWLEQNSDVAYYYIKGLKSYGTKSTLREAITTAMEKGL